MKHRILLLLCIAGLLAGPALVPVAALAQPDLDPSGAVVVPAELPSPDGDIADDDSAAVPVEVPAVVGDPMTDPPSDVSGIVEGVSYVISSWKTLGWLAGVTALINLLILVFRFPFINDKLTGLKLKWLKPLIAVILGAAFGGFSAALGGEPAAQAIIAGVLAALGSVGFHQLIDTIRSRET